jgi:hypothetical protein
MLVRGAKVVNMVDVRFKAPVKTKRGGGNREKLGVLGVLPSQTQGQRILQFKLNRPSISTHHLILSTLTHVER